MYTTRTTVLALILFGIAEASTAAPALRGDLNHDGRIDANDLALMRSVFFSNDARGDLNGDGHVDFADLAALRAAAGGVPAKPAAIDAPPQPPAVYLQPETQSVAEGDTFAVDLYWDFNGDATIGGGTDFAWDVNAFLLISIVFDDNFGTGPGQFDPAFTRCDNEPCSGPGFIDGLATGNFNGLAGDGPIYIATITFEALLEGTQSITLSEDDGIAGPFVSARTFERYPNLSFAGATVEVGPGEPQPRISISPAQLDFSDTIVGETSSLQLHVTSAGQLPLEIDSVSPPLAPFAVSADGCTGQTLPPQSSCDLTVDFSPTVTGAQASSLAINSNDPARPALSVTTSGTGVAAPGPDIVAQRMIDFDVTRIHQTASAHFAVRNIGTANLDIGQIGDADPLEPPFAVTDDNCSSRALLPNQTCFVTMSFAPESVGVHGDTIDIPSNDADSPSIRVVVRGNAVWPITLQTSGVAAHAGKCSNLTTGESVTVPLGDGAMLPCEGAGLTAARNDEVQLVLKGVALSETQLTGRALGVDVSRASCRNETTGLSVIARQEPWDCIARGLVVTPGDTVAMVVTGIAQ